MTFHINGWLFIIGQQEQESAPKRYFLPSSLFPERGIFQLVIPARDETLISGQRVVARTSFCLSSLDWFEA